MKVKDLLLLARNDLRKITESYQLEAELIIAHALNLSRTELFINYSDDISLIDEERIKKLIELRLKHIPLQYLTKKQSFLSNVFEVNEQVLIPRYDTEILVILATKYLKSILNNITATEINILDIGTGTGVIIISVINLLQDLLTTKYANYKFNFYATDINKAAIELTKKNAQKILTKFEEKKGRYLYKNLELVIEKYDLFPTTKNFQLILSNPPYLPNSLKSDWQAELNYEPESALLSGTDGLDIYRRIIANLSTWLINDGVFIGEIYENSANDLKALAHKSKLHYLLLPGQYDESRFIVLSLSSNQLLFF